jgi:hypothetical protein
MAARRIHPRKNEPDPIWKVLAVVEQRSMQWLADQTGWSVNTLRGYSAGQRRPPRAFCAAAAAALQMPQKELFRSVKRRAQGRLPVSMREKDSTSDTG